MERRPLKKYVQSLNSIFVVLLITVECIYDKQLRVFENRRSEDGQRSHRYLKSFTGNNALQIPEECFENRKKILKILFLKTNYENKEGVGSYTLLEAQYFTVLAIKAI